MILDLIISHLSDGLTGFAAQASTSGFQLFDPGDSMTTKVGFWATVIAVATVFGFHWEAGDATWFKIYRLLAAVVVLGHGYLYVNQIDIPFIENLGR